MSIPKLPSDEGNHIIALFDGAHYENNIYTFSPLGKGNRDYSISLANVSQLQYDISWDWLMPAVRKFDVLEIDFKVSREAYEKLCDEIDRAVTRYEITEVFIVFVKALKWLKDYLDIVENSMVGSSTKPKIGIMPEWLWKEQRLQALTETIERYLDSNQSIPTEWIEERNSLIIYFKERNEKKLDKNMAKI